ncbi:MAG: ABC transporter ATP-binding protein [Armatimonadetes bacterium]|nr:ABC transporter ATP-binding protein [Armatimonadota bacterium]
MGDVVVHALADVDVSIEKGEFIAVMGPSGSGKSTFMNMAGCLDRPTSGEVLLEGRVISHMDDDELADMRNRYVGFVFQSFNLLPRTTALQNVELPLMYAGIRDRTPRAQAALCTVGLEDRMRHKPNELSGGEQQRVAIARALVNDPVIIFADEPTGNLDTRTSHEIMAIFQELNRQGTTVVIVTHEKEVAELCSRHVRFRDGRVEEDVRVNRPVDANESLSGLPDGDPVA